MKGVSQHAALDALSKARLLELSGRLGLQIASKRRRAQVVDAIVSSRTFSFEQLLGAMQLEELQKICRRLELDPGAGKKGVLAARIEAALSAGSTPQPREQEGAFARIVELFVELHRSFEAPDPERREQVTRFTLQCLTARLAEQLGLAPAGSFTRSLDRGAGRGPAGPRVVERLEQLSARLGGGLSRGPLRLALDEGQLAALTRAAQADWSGADPRVLGAVFQRVMSEGQRHATGAHYTPARDIWRVVGPTIVAPWRERIAAAPTLAELRALRAELASFRVLDPACGSGDFLYLASRELHRLEAELLARMRGFGEQPRAGAAGISAANFYGIDINPIAVELARLTLAFAEVLARAERGWPLAEDPLPLKLEAKIICADALLVDWPPVDAIVGNPPILGDRKLRSELGEAYLERLRQVGGLERVVELSCYWFRKAHDHLPQGARAGLVGTSGLRVGRARAAALDYLVERGATITHAVSSMPWAGDAALDVCVVNWIKGELPGPHRLIVDGRAHLRAIIPTHLQLHADSGAAQPLSANERGTSMGVIFGSEAFRSTGEAFPWAARGEPFVRPVAASTPMLRGTLARDPSYCIYLVGLEDEAEAARVGGAAFEHLRRRVYPLVKRRSESGTHTAHYARWLETWWQPHWPRAEFFAAEVGARARMIVCSSPQARPIFEFLSTAFVPTNTLQVFAFDDDYSFGIIQSSLHWAWLGALGGKLGARPRYTTRVWRTFAWPQAPSEAAVVALAQAARALRAARRELMQAHGWSLRALYQAAELAGPRHPLGRAQARLDEAVARAYEQPAGRDPIEFLLELNLALAEREAAGDSIRGPGLPPEFAPGDRRLISEDCIRAP